MCFLVKYYVKPMALEHTPPYLAATNAEVEIRAAAAACLLSTARRALHEYGIRKDAEMDPMIELLAESVGVWADQHGVDRGVVSALTAQIDAEVFVSGVPRRPRRAVTRQ